MQKNTIILIILSAIILVGVVWYWVSTSPMSPANNTSSSSVSSSADNINNSTQSTAHNNQNTTQTSSKSTMYFSIADAAVDMKSVTGIMVTIDSVQAHSAVTGWLTASSTPQTFNLVDLKASNQALLLAKLSASPGTYDQFKLHVSKIMVTSLGTTKQAWLPSGNIIIKTDVMLNPHTSSAVQFDFLADKSLHQTGQGEFIFIPVIKFDSRENATVQVNANKVVSASFGKTNDSINVGMDIDGSVKKDFMVAIDDRLEVDNGSIKNVSTCVSNTQCPSNMNCLVQNKCPLNTVVYGSLAHPGTCQLLVQCP